MKLIAKAVGGSVQYGIQTPASDIDYRGIFLNTKVSQIIGLDKHEHQRSDSDDIFFWELRHAISLLLRGNTQIIELLYNQNWIEISPQWQLVMQYREKLLSSEKIFKCLSGYMHSEKQMANGSRTGKLGGKRIESITKYGYSPKNFCQLFRLAHCGVTMFQKGYFPVNLMVDNPELGAFCVQLKTNPESFKVDDLNAKTDEMQEELNHAFDNRRFDFKVDLNTIEELIYQIYFPLLQQSAQSFLPLVLQTKNPQS